MGGGQSQDEVKKINLGQWTNVGMSNGYEIVRSNMGNGQGQIRIIPMDPKHEVDKQMKIYSYRKNTDLPLVKCLGAEFTKSQYKTMCGNQQNVKVLTERIPKTLNEINSFSFPESLCVLRKSLRGFQDLYERAGAFEITDKMIGINNNGQPKVWLNQNFAQNHPAFERPILQTTNTTPDYLSQQSSERKMVDTIIQLVSQKCQSNGFPSDFKNYITKSVITFDEVYNNAQNYIKQRNIFVPATVSLIGNYGGFENNTNFLTTFSQLQNTNRFTVQSANRNNLVNINQGLLSPGNQGISSNVKFTSIESAYKPPETISYNSQPTMTNYTFYNNPITATTQIPTYTRVDNPYNFGLINRSTSPQRIATFAQLPQVSQPGKSVVSFNYKSPKNPIVTSQVIRQY